MNANGKQLQDIINSINNLNNINNINVNKSNLSSNKKDNNENKSENNNKREDLKDISEKDMKDNKEEKGKEKENKEGEKEEFVRPSFLNLYKTEDNSEMKQKVDINSYGETNRVDNTLILTKESISRVYMRRCFWETL